jgi:hypothetical protein
VTDSPAGRETGIEEEGGLPEYIVWWLVGYIVAAGTAARVISVRCCWRTRRQHAGRTLHVQVQVGLRQLPQVPGRLAWQHRRNRPLCPRAARSSRGRPTRGLLAACGVCVCGSAASPVVVEVSTAAADGGDERAFAASKGQCRNNRAYGFAPDLAERSASSRPGAVSPFIDFLCLRCGVSRASLGARPRHVGAAALTRVSLRRADSAAEAGMAR